MRLSFVANRHVHPNKGDCFFTEGRRKVSFSGGYFQVWTPNDAVPKLKKHTNLCFLVCFFFSVFSMYPVTWRIMVLVENDPDLKGKSAWRYIHFALNHDCLRESKKLFLKFTNGDLPY